MPRLKKEYIEQANASDIREVWTRLGLPSVRPGTAFRSPFREDKKPSCQLAGGKNIFFDHGTGERLDPIGLVRKVRGCDFKEAVAFVLGRPLDELYEQAQRPARKNSAGGGFPPGEAASAKGGGFPPKETVANSGGFPQDAIEELARVRGWRPEALRALGAVSRNAQAPREVHFPMRDASGNAAGFRRRRSDGKAFSNGSKALSSKGSKNSLLCPWPFPEDDGRQVLVVEGEADACAALSAGYAAVVATPARACPGRWCPRCRNCSQSARWFSFPIRTRRDGIGWNAWAARSRTPVARCGSFRRTMPTWTRVCARRRIRARHWRRSSRTPPCS